MAANEACQAWSLDEIRRVERQAIESGSQSGSLLMQRAGRSAFAALRRQWPAVQNLLVVCGVGNNGGDGYVVAALAAQSGMRVQLVETNASPRTSESRRARGFALEAGAALVDQIPARLPPNSLVVDALLGIGFSGRLRPADARLCQAINQLATPCFSLDVPSGVDVACAWADPAAVRADLTLSFIGLKAGLLTGSAAAHAGQLQVADLGLGDELCQNPYHLLDASSLADWQRPLALDSHKGSRGTCLVVGGAPGMAGAAMLAAQAALMTGVGKVRLASCARDALAVTRDYPEIMAQRVSHYHDLLPLAEEASAILIGPGLGRSAWAQQMLLAVLQQEKPTLLDADALQLLCSTTLQPHSRCLLTPHPGEAAALLGVTSARVQQNRFAAAAELVDKYACALVLKGNGSLLTQPGGPTWICRSGSPAMARAGMGDLLAGIAVGLLARQPQSGLAALQGATWLHAAAADDLLQQAGDWGVLPSRLVQHLPEFVHRMRSQP